jgi:hypothetical protein
MVARRLRRVQRLRLGFQVLRVHGVILQEGLQGRDHDVVRHGGQCVAVEELADRLGLSDDVGTLLVQGAVARGVCPLRRHQVRLVDGEVRLLSGRGAQECEHVPGRLVLAALLRQQQAVDRRLHGILALHRDLGEREEVDVVEHRLVGELLGDEGAEQVHAGLGISQGLGRFLPRHSERGRVLELQQLLPVIEDVLNLLLVPRLLVRTQVHVELVAVGAHVDVVEGAHGGPAVLVAEGNRHEVVGLHLGTQGDEFIEGLRLRVALGCPHALAVEEAPRVVVVRDEVLLAVRTGGCLGEALGVVAADLLPDIVDRGEQPLARVILRAVAGEPSESVVRAALQVGVDVVLEVVVRDGVGGDLVTGLLGEGRGEGRVRALRNIVRRAGAEGHGLRGGGSPTARSRSGTRREDGDGGGTENAGTDRLEKKAPVDGPLRECVYRHHYSFVLT